MTAKETEAHKRWMRENSKIYGVRIMKNSEPDLWEFLQGKESSAIIKLALREYMENHKEEQK